MPRYVDGFLIPVPKKNLEKYRRIARAAGKVWRDHGALEFRECVGDDLDTKMGVHFAKSAKARRGETVVFSWIVFRSRADRDRVNKKVMADPRMERMMQEMTDPKKNPFDSKRMAYGGFEMFVDL